MMRAFIVLLLIAAVHARNPSASQCNKFIKDGTLAVKQYRAICNKLSSCNDISKCKFGPGCSTFPENANKSLKTVTSYYNNALKYSKSTACGKKLQAPLLNLVKIAKSTDVYCRKVYGSKCTVTKADVCALCQFSCQARCLSCRFSGCAPGTLYAPLCQNCAVPFSYCQC
jgi:hypothetical protein